MMNAALLVMDFQPGILGRLEVPDELVERVRGAIATARAAGATIGYVRVALTEDEVAAVPDTNKSFSTAKRGGPGMPAGDDSTQVDPRLAPEEGDIVVRKRRVGAFSTTDLHEQLQAREIDTLVLAGVSTSGVVLSTTRDAADKDYRLYVLADGCADPDPEVHDVLLRKVLPRQADVITTATLAELLA
jgi:nicotinamidase-related amidase